MSGWSSTRRYWSTLTRPLWPVGNGESATSPGAFTPPAQTNTPPSTSWPSVSRKPSSVAAAILASVRTRTPRSERILAALSISCDEEPARMAGPASTSCTAGRSAASPQPLATLGRISASSPASSTPVAPPPPITTVARRRCCWGSVAAAAAVSDSLTAAHTRSASSAEYTNSARWARPGMSKSLGRLPSASTSLPQPIGPAWVSSRRPARSKPLISVSTKRTRSASISWSGMRTASAARVPPATRGSSVITWW
jgi:hypothetical protein